MTERNIDDLLGSVEGAEMEEPTAEEAAAFEQYMAALGEEGEPDVERALEIADEVDPPRCDNEDCGSALHAFADPEVEEAKKHGFVDPTAPPEPQMLSLEEMVEDIDWVWKRDRRGMSRQGMLRLNKVRQTLKQILADG